MAFGVYPTQRMLFCRNAGLFRRSHMSVASECLKGRSGIRLSARFALLVSLVVAISAILYFALNGYAQQESVKNRVLTEARTLNTEMLAVWDYIDDSQEEINRNADGSYDFKGIYCAVAGKGIAQRFTKNSEGYGIRYIRENPRIGTDSPDEFEQTALNSFAANSQTEFYDIVESPEGETVFRYVSALTIEENCLSCHGEPAREFDEAGFLKEGMKLGDLAGAVSIIIPLSTYEQEAGEALHRALFFFIAMTIGIVLIVRFALHRWVTNPLAAANAQLQSENEEKSNFLTIMSHELRTPLSSIIAATDFWEKTIKKEAGEEETKEERLVREIKENSKSLLDMVNNTIDVARLEAGMFETVYGEVDLTDVVGSTVRAVEALARKQNITLSKSIGADVPIVLSDAGALQKIVMNLLSNALKFTDEGDEVSISVEYCYEKEELLIIVQDTGMGISQENLENIFSRFEQGSMAKEQGKSGSGLGLFLVKSLSEELGGGVEVSSTVGVGSTFAVRVPAEPILDEDAKEE